MSAGCVATGGVVKESLKTDCGILAPGRIEKERPRTNGCVFAAGIRLKRASTKRRVVGACSIAHQCGITGRGVEPAGSVVCERIQSAVAVLPFPVSL
jgi:hypothetical protein